MDRRTLLNRALRPVAPATPATARPVEYLPGRFADPEALGIKWSEPAPRPSKPVAAPKSQPLGRRTGLEPYLPSPANPWDRPRALHLLRRTGFGATPAALHDALARSPAAAVDAIVDAALAANLPHAHAWVNDPPPESPPSAYVAYLETNRMRLNEFETQLYREALEFRRAGTALRERLALFWHNHFVAGLNGYRLAPWLHRYWKVLREHALGDFKAFVYAVSFTPAMLVYLDGVTNRVGETNENYARELLELFTMGRLGPDGQPNYTQQDIAELARTLTGWSVDMYGSLEAAFVPSWHDDGEKTVFGQTGPWSHADLVALLFEQRGAAIAHHVARALYRQFVYEVPNEDVVAALAAEFAANDFALEPTLRTLLKSAHFFDRDFAGARYKSPMELAFGLYRETGAPERQNMMDPLYSLMPDMGQLPFEPPNVAGWPGYQQWLTTNTLPVRWSCVDLLAVRALTLQALALAMPDPYDPAALTRDVAEFFLAVPLPPEQLPELVDLLLNGIPEWEWNPAGSGVEGRMVGLVSHLTNLPEYQLT